jgi:hypothetical protein
VNKSLARLTDKYLWAEYTGTKTMTPASGIINAPPAFQGMVQIVPTDDTFGSFQYLSEVQRRGNRLAMPYYMDSTTRQTDTTAISSITVANGATAIVATTNPFVAADIGGALLIGNNGYEYEVLTRTDANNITFSPAFRGATGTYRIVVRPAGVRSFILYDETDTLYATTVYLSYKKKAQALYNDYDRPLIDADEAILLGALIEALRNEKYTTDAERLYRDYESAVADCRQTTVRPPRTTLPRGLLTPMPSFSFNSNRTSGTGRTREF